MNTEPLAVPHDPPVLPSLPSPRTDLSRLADPCTSTELARVLDKSPKASWTGARSARTLVSRAFGSATGGIIGCLS